MLSAIQGGKSMHIAIHGVKLYALSYKRREICAHCYKWTEVTCSMLYMELSFMLIPIHEVKLCAHCYTWSEALCELRNME